MPLIELTHPADAIPADRLDPLAAELAATLMGWEDAPDTELFRSMTWTYLHQIPAGRVYVGGQAPTRPGYRVDVTVPAGALSQRRRDGLVTDVRRRTASSGAAGANSRQLSC